RSSWLARLFRALGSVLQFGGHNPGQNLKHLPFALRAVELTLGNLVDLRQERTQAGPQLVPGSDALEMIWVHDGVERAVISAGFSLSRRPPSLGGPFRSSRA